MVRIICYLLFVLFLDSGSSLAGGPLSVVYPEDTGSDAGESAMQQTYIDNQSYLREVEQQLRERALYPPPPAPVAVIRKNERGRSFSLFHYPYYRNTESENFLGVEVYGGATFIRYYDGYRPNFGAPRYYYRPAPPVASPYRSPAGRKR